jgi:hypothetical protein
VTLPFTRNLAGPLDYTPLLHAEGKNHAHQLAILVVFHGPRRRVPEGPGWSE